MNKLSVKQINNNNVTIIYKRDNFVNFMDGNNQIYLTKKIYNLHKSNHGILTYLNFKDAVPARMYQWAMAKNIRSYRDISNGSLDVLNYINNLFINDHVYLYQSNFTYNAKNAPDIDMFKNKFTINGVVNDNGTIEVQSKLGSQMTAADIQNLDVWEEQTVEVNADSNLRYGNKIPYWQHSMSVRPYDRRNEGYAYSIEDSSKYGQANGYGSAMGDLLKLKIQKNKKSYNNRPF